MNTCNKKNQNYINYSYEELVKQIGEKDIRIELTSSSAVNPLQLLKNKI
ncbi:hypothetical protein P4679_23545 [Priestia megaterium]|nr:hypothetical protein [Priestia megaterium]